MKHYLILSGIVGGIIGSVLTALLVSPVTAQRDRFGDIECTKLKVVNADGNARVVLSTDKHGGDIRVWDRNRKSGVWIDTYEHGGRVDVFGKVGSSSSSLGITPHGGAVEVYGLDQGKAVMGINEYGNGAVSTWDKNGYRQ